MDGPSALWNFLADRFSARGDALALVSADERISYTALTDRALQRGREIAAYAAKPGRWPVNETDGPVQSLIDVLAAWSAGLSPIILRRTLPDAARTATLELLQLAPQTSAEGLLGRTSGTTGDAKLAALPGSGVCLSMAAIADDFGWRAGDKLLAATSLSYSLGLTGSALAALYAGAEVHVTEPGAPAPGLLRRIRSESISLVQGPASLHRIFDRLATRGLENVRVAGQGGETCPPAVDEAMQRLYPNARRVQYFGMTEAGPRVAHIDMAEPAWLEGGMGRPFSLFEWRALDVPDSPLRQLWLKGPTVFLGYLGADGYYGLDADGGFATGDLVSLTTTGMPAYRGRLNRCFKSGGQWVTPYLVEHALESIDGVASSLCSAEDHGVLGQAPVAVVVPDDGSDQPAHSPAAIWQALEGKLEPFELPHRIDISEDLVRNDAGKISRPRSSRTL
jgi:acyl-coenzyme A synthetase/AMP-(fatty) acid ligase